LSADNAFKQISFKKLCSFSVNTSEVKIMYILNGYICTKNHYSVFLVKLYTSI
jgi:hypothetical protein